MKAVEYVKIARELLANPPLRSTIWADMPPSEEGPAGAEDIACEIITRLMREVKVICDARKANSEDAILAVMKELRQKWFAICDRMEHPKFTKPLFDSVCNAYSKSIDRRKDRKTKP